MPPLPPPYGKPTTVFLSVIKQANASAYSIDTCKEYLVPPFVGNL
jgi:hypothetical protein